MLKSLSNKIIKIDIIGDSVSASVSEGSWHKPVILRWGYKISFLFLLDTVSKSVSEEKGKKRPARFWPVRTSL